MASASAADTAQLRGFFARIGPNQAWLSDVSRQITDAIHAELPQLDADPEMRANTLASTENVLALLAEMMRTGQPAEEAGLPPAAVDYARQYVRNDLSLDALLRSFQVGHATFFRCWAALAHAELSDPAEVSVALELGAVWTFAFITGLSRDLVAQYTEERERWVRSAAALRAETVRSLLAGEPVDAHAAAQRLRYELARHHLGFVVWSDDGSAAGADVAELEHVAAELAATLGGGNALVVPVGPQLVAAWVGAAAPVADAVPAPASLEPAAAATALVALGRPATGVAGFAASHRQALEARRVAQLSRRRPGAMVRYRDVGLTALASIDPVLARAFVAEELGPLAEPSDEMRRLAATLRVYLEERASPRRAARRLGLHENTIKNRMRTVAELLGAPPEERIGELLVALRLTALDPEALSR